MVWHVVIEVECVAGGGVVEVDGGDYDMADMDVGLGEERNDGYWDAVWPVVCLVVDDDSGSRDGGDWRHVFVV